MTIVAVAGDCATTTSLALASVWPDDGVTVLEADRGGGSLAAWLDTPATPSLSTIVAGSHTTNGRSSEIGPAIDSMTRESSAGIRFIAAPVREREASRSIAEASSELFPWLAADPDRLVIADVGHLSVLDPVPPVVALARSIVVCHRQSDSSARAAAVRVERLAELVDALGTHSVRIAVALIGRRPFDAHEVAAFIDREFGRSVQVHELADDALSAAVFAGRTGVSTRRFNRLPLIRSVRPLATSIADSSTGAVDSRQDVAP